MQIAKVAVEKATYSMDKPYSYLVPEELGVAVGCRVLVPFGRGNRPTEGVVLSVEDGVPDKPLKTVRANLDGAPLISEKEIKMALWMCKRYFCTFYDAIRTIMPAAVWYHYRQTWRLVSPVYEVCGTKEEALCRFLADGPQDTDTLQENFGEQVTSLLYALKERGILTENTDTRRKVRDKFIKIVALAMEEEKALSLLSGRRKTAREAVTFLARCGDTPLQELTYYTGASRAVITVLEKQGIVALYERETYRISEKDYGKKAAEIRLNDEQETVYQDVLQQVRSGRSGVTLLQGVTGSGKTLIYIRLAQTLLAEGKSVMILVPEIALTPQMMARFTAYFGSEVALLHSALRQTERYDQWKRLRRGEAHIVLGTRSAVFAPMEKLGLIIMDEEQEGSYQSENAPCYHARDIAKYRAVQEGARLLLGSATPTVETTYFARRGDYQLALLRRRYNEKALPKVIMADMGRELREGNLGAISRELYAELKENLDRGEQSILFLNRRGASRRLVCTDCGHAPQCPRCSVYLTYHSANGRLMCHYCGYSEKAEDVCPDCGNPMKRIGIGTQKVAEELETLFPGTPILRMDADTVSQGHEVLLKRFETEKVPILLGTQMVAKGLDFENVTLVGVLDADLGLYVDHYRAAERTFSLLTQVVGRAGRGEKEGRAVIQTFTPQNDVIMAAAQQDYERFYDGEIRLRKLRREPPFYDLFTVSVTGTVENEVRRAAAVLLESLQCAVKKEDLTDVDILGPAPYPVVKVNERYRYRLTVVGQNNTQLRNLLSAYMRAFTAQKENKHLHIFIDCNLMD